VVERRFAQSPNFVTRISFCSNQIFSQQKVVLA
jgi:hypothetical protein